MQIDGAIFDMDGTLLDSMPVWGDVGRKYLLSRGIEIDRKTEQVFWSMSLAESAEYCRERFGMAETVQQIIDGILERISEFYMNEAKLKSGVKEFIGKLYKNGVKMCVATASDRRLAEAALNRNGILKYFSAVFTCNEIGAGKEYPDVFNAALEHMGTERNNTVVFEDALYAVKTAKKAGFKVVGMYDESERENARQIKDIADYYFVSMSDAEEILL